MSTPQKTLLERIGGEVSVLMAVDLFYSKVIADPELKFFFEYTDMVEQHKHQRNFLKSLLSGAQYNGRTLSVAHAPLIRKMGLTVDHFNAVVGHLVETLVELNVPGELINDIAGVVPMLQRQIFGYDDADQQLINQSISRDFLISPEVLRLIQINNIDPKAIAERIAYFANNFDEFEFEIKEKKGVNLSKIRFFSGGKLIEEKGLFNVKDLKFKKIRLTVNAYAGNKRLINKVVSFEPEVIKKCPFHKSKQTVNDISVNPSFYFKASTDGFLNKYKLNFLKNVFAAYNTNKVKNDNTKIKRFSFFNAGDNFVVKIEGANGVIEETTFPATLITKFKSMVFYGIENEGNTVLSIAHYDV